MREELEGRAYVPLLSIGIGVSIMLSNEPAIAGALAAKVARGPTYDLPQRMLIALSTRLTLYGIAIPIQPGNFIGRTRNDALVYAL